ncbi:MAG: cysteine--tRNA ligase [Gammaproteobacteria bacterium]|nr:cysteine--tRNA ligase [Gammaproteobacteria bacterium]
MLQIYNSLTREKEEFKPIDPANVRMYVCGMTVYDFCHIGHARVLVVFDVVYRYLKHVFGDQHVTYIRNITDIDDKIIQRANQNGEPFSALTERFIEEMNRDADGLGVLRPDQEPQATGHMPQILEMIEALISNGHAYAAKNGDVYYDVSKFENYGKLSGRNLEEDRAGARVEVDEAKDDAMDFVLWKAAKPGEPNWESPWGQGRPGWHIECSAMSTHCLGNNFDIHGGGMDLKFPHHENEIAQSEAATGEHFANLWMHNGHVMVDNEKMSKSLDNFFTVREVLKHYPAEVIRYFILTSHYRSPLNYSQTNLDNARAALERFYGALRGTEESASVDAGEYGNRFHRALQDDFNTPEALSVLFDVVRELNRAKGDGDQSQIAFFAGVLRQLAGFLGLLQTNPEVFFKQTTPVQEGGLSDEDVEALIQQRLTARSEKNWAEADRIRDELKEAGIVLEDAAGQTTWRRI